MNMICVIPDGDCPPEKDYIKVGDYIYVYKEEGYWVEATEPDPATYPIDREFIDKYDLYDYFCEDDFDEDGEYIAP